MADVYIATGACCILAGLLLVVAAVVVHHRRRVQELEHEGATADSPPLPLAPPIEFDEPPVGRHHPDTVEIVPPDYQPPPGQRRIDASIDDTQQFKAVDE